MNVIISVGYCSHFIVGLCVHQNRGVAIGVVCLIPYALALVLVHACSEYVCTGKGCAICLATFMYMCGILVKLKESNHLKNHIISLPFSGHMRAKLVWNPLR